MKVKIIKSCVDGVTHQRLYVGDVMEFTEERLSKVPVGYVEVISEEKHRGRPKKEVNNE